MLAKTNLKDFGSAFRADRKALGMTQTQVASDAMLRRETIIRLESGENVVAISLMRAVLAIGKGLAISSPKPEYEQLKSLFNDN